MSSNSATVEVLAAEVRVLMVGSRQVTLSVARQLDEVSPDLIIPFGRVRIGKAEEDFAEQRIEVVGSVSGVLARSSATARRLFCTTNFYRDGTRLITGGREVVTWRCGSSHEYAGNHDWTGYSPSAEIFQAWAALPLIVLAGLR